MKQFILVGSFLFVAAAQAQDCPLANLDPFALDKNQDGRISRTEAEGSTLAWSFDQVDQNGDGVINQQEFSGRCAAFAKAEPREPTAAEQAAAAKAERQKGRQGNRVNQRVDKETDKAVDGVIDRGLDRLFGR